ncbi:MAG: zinc-dependent alcohol dehydrogenase family protein [Leptospirales bacterium]
MKAVLLSRPGGPESLEIREIPKPVLPSSRHMLVRLHAAGVNPVDYKLRRNGTLFPGNLPAILGCDGAGTVEETGTDVTLFRRGDRVFFMHGGFGKDPGTYAEWTTVPEWSAAHIPDPLTMEEAAALPIPLITAWESLTRPGPLPVGSSVLIHAGAGGVGHMAIQLAQNFGMSVLTTVRGQEKAAMAEKDGACHTIDPDHQDFVQETLRLTGGKGVNLLMDTLGGEIFCRSFGAVRLYGHVVTLLEQACPPSAILQAKQKNLSLHYILVLSPAWLERQDEQIRQTRILAAGAHLSARGALKVRINRILPLDQVRDAHELIESGHLSGKIVLSIR